MTALSRLRTRLGFQADDVAFHKAAALSLMLALLPLLQALPSDTDRTAALAFAPVVWFILRSNSDQGKAEAIDRWLLVFAGLMALISVVFSQQMAANLVLTCAWIWTIAIGLAARRLAQSAAAIRLIITGLALGCCTGLLWARSHPIGNDIAFPLYGHVRIFGLHMQLGAAAALALLVNASPGRISRGFAIVTGVVVWSGLLWSGSRGPLAGLAVGIGAWWWFGSAMERKRLALWTALLVLAALAGANLLGTQARTLGWHRVVASTVNATSIEGFSSDRHLIWGQTLREIGPNPLIGQGADAYRFFKPVPVGDQPHNFILQWVLAFGAPAALALLILLGRRISRGLHGAASVDEASRWRRAAAGGLLAATVGALFDGVFYHAVSLIPAAVLTGLSGYSLNQNASPAKILSKSYHLIRRVVLITTACVIAIHGWLFFNLLAPPPSSPLAPAARVLRVFPSSTYGFWRWIDTWTPALPVTDRIDWLHWAQHHSPQPAIFHYQEAQCRLEEHDLEGACVALTQAISTSNGANKRFYSEMLRLTREVVSRSASSSATQNQSSP
jgi:hypothetical protein